MAKSTSFTIRATSNLDVSVVLHIQLFRMCLFEYVAHDLSLCKSRYKETNVY